MPLEKLSAILERPELDLESMLELDKMGLFPEPGMTPDAFKSRLASLASHIRDLNEKIGRDGRATLLDSLTLRGEDRIPDEVRASADAETERLYSFVIDWAPGFFMTEAAGLLWGGCAIILPETSLPLFLLRNSFRDKRKWLLYGRDELLAHELCHVARAPLGDRVFEEFFAYRTSPSRFRRLFGSCFQTRMDAVFFLLPVLLLLAAQMARVFLTDALPVWPFWIFTAVFPVFLAARNQLMRGRYFKAERNLRLCGVEKPGAVLFRCSESEIREISALSVDGFKKYAKSKAESEIRWKIIEGRFIDIVSDDKGDA